MEPLDGGPGEQPPTVNVVRIQENGPLALHAPVCVEGSQIGLRVTLCRCGTSKRKPFCDGSHAAAQFIATGEPPTQESVPLVQRDGPVELTAIRNGPLKLIGPLEIVSGTGRTVDRCTEAFLCRCGASARKPYCDGTHKRIGFRSE
jgi:CDGSH-type Zn-finger protein